MKYLNFFAGTVACCVATFASAGEQRFQPAWTPSARADLVRLIMMDGWTSRDANYALDVFVQRLESHTDSSSQQSLAGTDNFASDAVNVGLRLSPGGYHNGCVEASGTLANAMRPTTAVSGQFCSKSQDTWSFTDRFLEVSRVQQFSNKTLHTYDVSDLGRVRPR